MVIGILERKIDLGKYKIMETSQVNSDSSTFVFKSVTKELVFTNVKKFYPDVQMIGRHFLIWAESKPLVKRQYTIANCMRFETYKAYINAMN
jgi:hypothetical protein